MKMLGFMKKSIKIKLISTVMCLGFITTLSSTLNAQLPQHSYPLIGWQTFSGAVEDYYARFDMVITRNRHSGWADKLKQMNPTVSVIHTYDWNTAQSPYIDNFPDSWFLRDSQGNKISGYGNYMMVNLSDVCPKATSGAMANMRYVDYLPTFLTELVDLNHFDGLATDGIWGRTGMAYMYNRDGFADVDIDNNGVNDHDEMSDSEWLNRWQGGIDVLMDKLRAKVGPNKLIIINSGTKHTWGWSKQNGIIVEKRRGFFNDKFDYDWFNNIKKYAVQPYVTLEDGMPYNSHPKKGYPSKDSFTEMRFGIVMAMFNDHYYSFQDIEASEHYWSFWYDEFDVDLGRPTGPPREIRPGLWVRFFDNGCAIGSCNGQSQSASANDLTQFSEYSGPYFRFKGGQNPGFNNGKQFDSIDLHGTKIDGRYFGDGIILLKKPFIVVSDIIIDNSPTGTSPSSTLAKLSTGFEQYKECYVDGYVLSCKSWLDTYETAISYGSGTAVFRPTISISGYYKVYEWHPRLSGMASNVKHRVQSADGSQDFTINQQQNSGQWNEIGRFKFSNGTNGFVEIQTDGSNGAVAADAIKFVFDDYGADRDFESPNPPGNITIEVKGN
ncbi:MAG: hypothetical protein DWQ05_19775 [Calditrichaeota bacterium]|nr:MAG: hypothetical protein DWQ05_19775 [Calditrichota bacterium]